MNDRLNDQTPFVNLVHFEDFAVSDRYASPNNLIPNPFIWMPRPLRPWAGPI